MATFIPKKITLPIRNKVIPPPENTILFSRISAKYGYLSNYYPSHITIDDTVYHHVEGYFQSQKFIKDDIQLALRIQNILSPADCKREANIHKMTTQRRKEWDNGLRIRIMRRAVLCKFIYNTDLATKLISTGDMLLVEDATYDNFWGNGKDGNGFNMLGKILMEIRDILKDINS